MKEKEYVGVFLWHKNKAGKLVITCIEKDVDKLFKERNRKKCQKN